MNLVFTGAYGFSAVGTGGRCSNPFSSSGEPALFSFEGTDGDFPGMGLSYSMVQGFPGNPYVDVKWVIVGNTAFALPGPASPNATLGPVTLSANHRSITIDSDLAEFATAPRHQHVRGTIDCPE